eukprot:2029431-Prymnesium_polylepis.1
MTTRVECGLCACAHGRGGGRGHTRGEARARRVGGGAGAPCRNTTGAEPPSKAASAAQTGGRYQYARRAAPVATCRVCHSPSAKSSPLFAPPPRAPTAWLVRAASVVVGVAPTDSASTWSSRKPWRASSASTALCSVWKS